MNKCSLFWPITRSAHKWVVLLTTRVHTRHIRHFAFQQLVCLRQTAVIYATFPFLLTPLCQITTGSLTSLTLHTLHSIEVGWGGGSLLGTAWHSSVAGQAAAPQRLSEAME